MKRFIFLLIAIFICTIAYAHTINWRVGNTILETTTCDSGESITPPAAPYKYGYHFKEWLPYSARIEYLESTGTQYIDTGVIGKSSVRRLLQTLVPNADTNAYIGPIFGIRTNLGIFWAMFFSNYSPNTIRFDYGQQTSLNCTSSNSMQGKIVVIDMNNHNKASIYDTNHNLLCTQNLSTTTFTTGENLFLFASLDTRQGTPIFLGAPSVKIYSAKIYDNDVLVRDFIPVLDKNGTPCMFDKVEKKFYYNQGTGQFIAGPVIGE